MFDRFSAPAEVIRSLSHSNSVNKFFNTPIEGKMKTVNIFLLISLIAGLVACGKEEEAKAKYKPVNLSEKQKALVRSSNTFGFDFFEEAFEQAGTVNNIMVSPLSISMALGMTRNGASGSTLTDMTRTLGFEGMGETEINQSYLYIIETLSSLDPKVNLSIANSIWYRNTFEVEPDFLSVNNNYFNASVTALDFTNPASVGTINNWVNDKTNSLIPQIIENISSESMMFLINAIYFKGQWKYQFDKGNSATEPFYLINDVTINAESMVQRSTLPYYQNSILSAVELPYNQGNFVMTIAKPNDAYSLSDVISELKNASAWVFANTDVQVKMPKFKYAYDEKNMKQILSQMGMGIAFSESEADFTRINSGGNLFISDVKHKSFIETNEEGTEAAAVTSVEVGTTSAGGDDNPIYFTVNKPFVYFISEKATNTILFIGVVYNPTL